MDRQEVRRILSIRDRGASLKLPARLTREEWEAFQGAAAREGRSATSLLSMLIRRHLRESGLRSRERGRWKVRILTQAEADRHDSLKEYWLTRPPQERVGEARRLSRMGFALEQREPPPAVMERTVKVVRSKA